MSMGVVEVLFVKVGGTLLVDGESRQPIAGP